MSTSKTLTFTLFIATLLASWNNNYPLNIILKATHIPYGIDLPDHKATGRFSNGKLIPGILAAKFNIKQFVPPFLQPNLSDQEIVTGVCFASAGAGYDERSSLSSQAIPVSYQPTMFRSYIARLKSIVGDKKAMEIINNALVVVSAGTNDFILNFYTIPTRRLEYPFISAYQEFILKRLDNFLRELYSLGFKETKRGCCGTGLLEAGFMCNAFSPSCGNRSEYLFFDSIHPSEATYNYVGDLLEEDIRNWIAA
ncbi:unnamed protein product [Thlaspi arvense]|uniref:Uncharacterized protein n=2 Tax=Thlaspi arvense TaxID=13288 RepID=A0AAU9SBF3_THLAR|nr:unnamed protein product [Thlaspi arvense]